MTVPPYSGSGSGGSLRKVGETCLWLIAIAVVVWGLTQVASTLRVVVLPALLALVLSTLLAPAAKWLRAHGWPRAVAALAVVATFVLLFVALGAALGPSVVGQLGPLGTQLTNGLHEVQQWLTEGPLDLSERQVSAPVERLIEIGREDVGTLAQSVITGAGMVASVVAGLMLTVVIVFFFLKDGDRIWSWLLGLVPRRRRNDVRESGERAWAALAAFLRGQTVVALFDATSIGLGLAIVGVPLALPLAVLVFVATYVPYLGAIVSGTAAVLVALVSHGGGMALIVLAIVLVVMLLDSNVVYPFVMGRALTIHPLVTLLGLVAAGALGGIVGAIVAMPVIAATSGVFGYLRERQLAAEGEAEAASLGSGAA